MADIDPEYLTAAVEQRVADMSEAEFTALIARTRPPQADGSYPPQWGYQPGNT